MPHFTNSLYSLRMPESLRNRPTKRNPTHRYNSFIAHVRIHELKGVVTRMDTNPKPGPSCRVQELKSRHKEIYGKDAI